jgi:hypothetical protein
MSQYLPWIAAALFALAVIHTFCTKYFEHLAHINPRHAGIWHLLGEVEVVFGFWALVLVLTMFALLGRADTVDYLNSRNFTEPLFVFAIMVVAGTRAVLAASGALVQALARLLPMQRPVAEYLLLMSFVPLLGSFITEPAAMTLAALMLRDRFLGAAVSERLRYATLGVLFVNISIGGTLTPFAAPPVLMVAATWNWDIVFMLTNFGWKAALAVAVNAGLLTLLFRRELAGVDLSMAPAAPSVPLAVTLVHGLFLLGIVVFAHDAVVFVGLLLFFIGYAGAYPQHQDRLILRESLLVAFFLGGLVVLGGQQQWWLQPLLMQMSEGQVFFGATALTAITDNAALTYLGSLVEGLSEEFKIALVAGAVTGGGLTVIANAPNPAGVSILKERFSEATISPLGLLLAALPPTLVAALAFRLL